MANIKKPKTNELISRAKKFFINEIIPAHLDGALVKASKIENYNINPFTVRYIATLIDGNSNPKAMAKALLYPRVFGTSISTIFGNKLQQMMTELFSGYGSATEGIDIEFIDFVDKTKKYCQIKAGPNTINKDDVKVVIDHFRSLKRRARTNHLKIATDEMIVGVLYGHQNQLSGHYKKIAIEHPVYVGQDFWHRITGDKNFYFKLATAIGDVLVPKDGRGKLSKAISSLAKGLEKGF